MSEPVLGCAGKAADGMSGSGSVVEAEADSVPALEDISSEDESVPSLVYSDLSEIECEVVPRPLPVAHESSTADDDEDDPDFDADDGERLHDCCHTMESRLRLGKGCKAGILVTLVVAGRSGLLAQCMLDTSGCTWSLNF